MFITDNGNQVALAKAFHTEDGKQVALGKAFITEDGLYKLIWNGSGKFIIFKDYIYTADDVTWIKSTVNVSNTKIVSVSKLGTKVVGLSEAGASILSTDSGETWNKGYSSASGTYSKMRALNNEFVACGTSGFIYRSSDGITWTKVTPYSSSLTFYSCCYGAGKYLFSAGSGIIYYTTSLTSPVWEYTQVSGAGSGFSEIVYINNTFIATSNNSSQIFYSTDGINWQYVSLSTGYPIHSITYGKGMYVISSAYSIHYSTNLTTWTKVDVDLRGNAGGIAFGNDMFIVVDNYGKFFYSKDALTWTAMTSPSTYDIVYDVCYVE